MSFTFARTRARAASWLLCVWLGGCSETSLLGLTPTDNEAPMSDAGGRDEDDPSDEHVPSPPPPEQKSKVPCGYGGDCDPRDLGGETCNTLGLGEGQLLCDPVTCTYSLAFCGGLPREQSQNRPCGTGPGCDPDDLGGQSCQSLGLAAGVLGCDPQTCELDTSLCGVTFGAPIDEDAGTGPEDDAGTPTTFGGFGGGNFGGFGGGNAGGGFFGGGA